MEPSCLEQLSARAGIGTEYINASGQRQTIEPQILRRLLAIMGNRTGSPEAPPSPVPEVFVRRQDEPAALRPAGQGGYRWRLMTEQGEIHHGAVNAGQALALPPALPCGYHLLILAQGKDAWHCRVIIAPERYYQPPALTAGRRLWGTCVQLHTLRSAANWGIGDTGDLKAMVREIARRGGAFIGLDPIHALYPALPGNASPYRPSSRRWLNTLYIDVNDIEDFQHSPAAQRWRRQADVRQTLAEARAADQVDYPRVARLKMTALRLAWQQFLLRPPADGQRADFDGFRLRGGESLRGQGVFDALHAHLLAQDPAFRGWQAWPQDYRIAEGAAVGAFCRRYPLEVEFYLWLQWLADRQFTQCYALSREMGMPIGLYRDLAVGESDGGAETWNDPGLYCLGASVGAPPDILGPQGQNWGLAPMDPKVLIARGYQPFIDLLRSNMRGCGALRIDHVMSLLRLWWIPRGDPAALGAYVYYPLDDLLAILALESQRHGCMVIGEDLAVLNAEEGQKKWRHEVAKMRDLDTDTNTEHTQLQPK